MQPLSPEERKKILVSRPDVTEEEIDDYEQLLAFYFAREFGTLTESEFKERIDARARKIFGERLADPNDLSPLVTVRGKLVRVVRNPGSKSEHMGYAVQLVVEMRDDNPFTHESLQPLDGKMVHVTGRIWHGKLIGTAIEPQE